LRIRPAILLLLAALALSPAAEAAAAERIYVLSQAGAALSEVEDGTDVLQYSIPLDKAPAALALAPDAPLAYVTHPDLGRVSVVDLGARRVISTFKSQGSPFGLAVARGGRIFVGDWNGSHVTVIDDGATPGRTIEVGRAPAHLLLTPDERMLFVANRESDTVSAVRTDTLAVAATIAVGRAPFAMALSPDASRLYVGNVQGGTVSVIDTKALAVIETLQSGAMPYGAAVTPDGQRVLVTNQQASTLSVLESRGGPLPPIKVGGYPEGLAATGDGARAYVANWFSDDISVVDLRTLAEVRRIKCPAGPRGVAVSAQTP